MKFHIPEPCHENWNEMTPTEKGAYCQKCALEVTDFTRMSPFEIRDVLTEKFQNKERNCGHITHRQLEDVNDIGFYWRNEQQRFQSVWMVSLLAVFGLTLFSCQNTYTKEIVFRMEEEANIMLQDSSENISEDIAVNKTNVPLDTFTSIVPPYPEITYDGLISWREDVTTGPISEGGFEISIINFPVCMGSISVTTGDISYDPEQGFEELLKPLGPFPKVPLPTGELIRPWPERNNIGKRSDIVPNTETTDFIAYITPAPLSIDSQLIIESYGNHEIHFYLENVVSNHVHTDKYLSVSEGIQAFNLGLDKLPEGNYQLELSTWRTNQTIQFQWLKAASTVPDTNT